MSRRLLIDLIQREFPLDVRTRAQAAALADAYYDAIAKEIAVEGAVRFPGIGTLRVGGTEVLRVRFTSARRLRALIAHASRVRGGPPRPGRPGDLDPDGADEPDDGPSAPGLAARQTAGLPSD